MRFYQSVSNVITWSSTLADSASHYLYINFVLFFLKVGKNTLMTANKVPHSPYSYQILARQMKTTIQVAVYKDIDFSRKKNKGMCVNQPFSLTVDDVKQKTYCIIAKTIREGFMVFCRAFSNA
jgi:hypothetical protein